MQRMAQQKSRRKKDLSESGAYGEGVRSTLSEAATEAGNILKLLEPNVDIVKRSDALPSQEISRHGAPPHSVQAITPAPSISQRRSIAAASLLTLLSSLA